MAVRKKSLSPHIKRQFINYLVQAIADIKSTNRSKEVIESLLKDSELDTLARRLAVSYWIRKGRTDDNIQRNLGVSASFIHEVKIMMKKKGYDYLIRLMEAEEFANVWSEKIKKYTKKVKK